MIQTPLFIYAEVENKDGHLGELAELGMVEVNLVSDGIPITSIISAKYFLSPGAHHIDRKSLPSAQCFPTLDLAVYSVSLSSCFVHTTFSLEYTVLATAGS